MTSVRKSPKSKHCGLLSGLGLVGLRELEAPFLGSLISEDPLLLIGPHGTGKSYLLERIATAMGLEWRHYNASLLNFDDLVGYPLPDEKGGLQFVQTPASIWNAEAVFLDEISRCRPDMQNKLFPIIHERRVQGLPLQRLRYRWSAMNPPPTEEPGEVGYLGSEPLDQALADRFAFVLQMPAWRDLDKNAQEQLLSTSGAALRPEAVARLHQAVAEGQRLYKALQEELRPQLAGYVRMLLGLLDQAGTHLSARRGVLILRNIVAVHAATIALGDDADLGGSAYRALTNSLPHAATGEAVKAGLLLTAHREAWAAAALDPLDPRRLLLAEPDPLRRALLATRLHSLAREDFSAIVADGLSSLPNGGRHAFAAWLFEHGHVERLVAAVAEQCAQLYSLVCIRQQVNETVMNGSARASTWGALSTFLARRPAGSPVRHLDGPRGIDESWQIENLLVGLFVSRELTVPEDAARALEAWRNVRGLIAGRRP
jgi:MoxR-like ATPase